MGQFLVQFISLGGSILSAIQQRTLQVSMSNTFANTVTGYLLGDSRVGGHSYSNYIATVPEPETYAMLLAGLGFVGFTVRRKERNKAAN